MPSNITLAFWLLRQTWRLLLIIGMGMVAAVVLVCSVPLYSQVMTTAGLRDAVAALGGNADITVQSVTHQVSPTHTHLIQQKLDQLTQKALGQYLSRSPQFFVQTPVFNFLSHDLYVAGNSVQLLGAPMGGALAHVNLIQGRLPQTLSSTLEIALTSETADGLHVKVGSVLTVQISYFDQATFNTPELDMALHVVGIFTPKTNDPFWHGQDFESTSDYRFTTYRALMSSETFLSLFNQDHNPALADAFFTDPPALFWYYQLDTSRIDVNNLDSVVNGLNNLLETISQNPIDRPYIEDTQSTGPIHDLQGYENRLTVVRISVTSLTLLVAGLVLFFVALMTELLVDRHADAIAVLHSRGASRRQIFGALVTQSIGLGLCALLLGPLLAVFLVRWLAQGVLSASDQNVLTHVTGNTLQVAIGLGWFSLVAVGAALLATIVAIVRATRMNVLSVRREAARSTSRLLWLRLNLDIIAAIVALTGYALSLYVTSPNVLNPRTRVLVLSPLTLIGTVFLLFGGILLFLRIFPFLLSLGTRFAMRSRGAAALLAVAQMARSSRHSLRMTLLLAFAIAFALFTLIFTASQTQRLPDVVAYQVGADFSGTIVGNTNGVFALKPQEALYDQVPGVISSTVGYTNTVRAIENGGVVSPIELRAVDADNFAQTGIWTSQDSSQSLASLMAQLVERRSAALAAGVVPAIIDTSAASSLSVAPGSRFVIDDAKGQVNAVVLAEVQHMPTVTDSSESTNNVAVGGVLVDFQSYTDIFTKLNGDSIVTTEVWLRTRDDTKSLASVRQALSKGGLQLTPFSDRRAIIASLSNDPLYLDLVGLLTLGATMALLLALLGNLIASWLNARGRLTNFAVLRALGGTRQQLANVLLWEQAIVYSTAIVIGMLFGFLLSQLALPALVFTNVGDGGDFYVLQSVPSIQVVIPYSSGVVICTVVVICVIALGMMVRVVSQPAMSKVLRLNED